MLLLLLVAAALVIVRAILPELVEAYVNDVIDRTEDYDGRIEDVDLALWRGAYVVKGLRLDHRELEELRPLLGADRIDLSIEWRALLRGELVGEVDVHGLVYNVVAAPPAADEALAQTGEEPDLAERLSDLFPLSINRLEIHSGEIHYRDPHRSPAVDVALLDVEVLARNWSNVHDRSDERFARAWMRARALQSARLVASLEANPLASPPEFVLALVTEGIDLTELDAFLQAYGGFDAEAGQLDLYVEVEASDGRFEGYVKPVVRDLDVLGEEDERESWLARIWEGVVGVVAEVFENQFSGRQATRIPIEGEWGEMSPDLVAAVTNVLYNAFIDALPAHLEHPERLESPGEDARQTTASSRSNR